MKGRFLLYSSEARGVGNVYADKSSIVLDWLLREGLNRESLSLREVAKDRGVSVGLVQKVFANLVLHGLLDSEGVRTAKKFFLKKPERLLKKWLQEYSIVKKCKMWTYRSRFQGKADILKALENSILKQKVAFALHSAAEVHRCKNTNLQTLELYLLDPSIKAALMETLQLEPQERGYEVLLIEPYYKTLLKLNPDPALHIKSSPVLLTYLDLYHFPLRGQEQADFMAERVPELKHIYKKSK